MNDKEATHGERDGGRNDASGDKAEKVRIGLGGVHVKDSDSEVNFGWTGIRVRDGETDINVNLWKPLIGCGIGLIVFVGILTVVVISIVKLMT